MCQVVLVVGNYLKAGSTNALSANAAGASGFKLATLGQVHTLTPLLPPLLPYSLTPLLPYSLIA